MIDINIWMKNFLQTLNETFENIEEKTLEIYVYVLKYIFLISLFVGLGQ